MLTDLSPIMPVVFLKWPNSDMNRAQSRISLINLGIRLQQSERDLQLVTARAVPINLNLSLTNSHVIIGIFIGAILPGLISAFTMRSVGRAAGQMVTEIRRQFREIPGLLAGEPGVKPDVARCVQISTKAALSEMLLPGVVAIVTPVIVG